MAVDNPEELRFVDELSASVRPLPAIPSASFLRCLTSSSTSVPYESLGFLLGRDGSMSRKSVMFLWSSLLSSEPSVIRVLSFDLPGFGQLEDVAAVEPAFGRL